MLSNPKITPPKTERNQAIAARYARGQRPATIARIYRISRERVRQILAKYHTPEEPTQD
jgi:Mor family transcriptional regulator